VIPELVVYLALVVLAALFALVEVYRTHGQDAVAWGVLALAIALIVARL
jgi:hypothetical protein